MKLIKKFINIILVFCIFIINIIPVSASSITGTITDPDGVNVRKGPGTNYKKVGVLSYTATFSLVDKTLHKGQGCNKGWYQINYNGTSNNYICSDLAKLNETSSQKTYYTTPIWESKINENYANIRTSPNLNSKITDRLYLGAPVNIIGTSGQTSGCSTGWYKVSYYNATKTGYICKRLVDKYEDITLDDKEYAESLVKLGFPKSYTPFLSKIHKDHPTWVFKISETNKNFNDAVNGEKNKNYIQSTEPVYITDPNPKESGTWYTASNPIVAYYLDPRNYLNEKNIFAFEELGYDKKNHTAEVLKAIFNNSYLKADEYVNYFLKAADEFKISPVHLASRVIQEGGSNENYDGVSGKSTLTYNGKPLTGVYNYYNIGAHNDSYTKSPVARGLAVAKGYVDHYKGTPWDTREKAIYYGAEFIANHYINKGQNTMYYQKFNVNKDAYYAPYTNQYMTNIIAPASEALSTYGTYRDQKMIDTPFVFAIPVYKNMPNEFTSHPFIGETNNDLTEIKIDGIKLNNFDPDVRTYTTYINYNATEVNIEAIAKSNKSKVEGTGKIQITNDSTEVKINVTSEVGETKTYIITLIKQEKEEKPNPDEETKPEETTPENKVMVEDIINKIDVKINDNYLTGIVSETTVTTLTNMIKKEYPNAEVKVIDKNNKIKTNLLATGDKITIKTKDDTKDYTIVIKGDINGDGKISGIDMLRVQKHILELKIQEGPYKEACDVNYDGKISGIDMLRVQKHILKYIIIK